MGRPRITAAPVTTREQCTFAVALMLLCLVSHSVCAQSSSTNQQSISTLKRQAEAGNVEAQAQLGERYFSGKDVEKNPTEGFLWSYKAALAGNPTAARYVGTAYLTGTGVVKNQPASFDWLRISAMRGDELAQCVMVREYFGGHGVNRDLTMAYAWGQIARSTSIGRASKLVLSQISELESTISNDQKSEALSLAKARAGSKDHLMPIHSLWYLNHPEEHQRTKEGETKPPQPTGCSSGHWLSSKTDDGKYVTLEDDSLWEIDSADTVDTVLWLETDSIVVCNGKLIDTDDKTDVSAKRIK